MLTRSNIVLPVFISFLCLGASLFFSGCRRTIEVEDPTIGSMDDLNVHSSFDWQTSKEVELLIVSNFPSLPAGAVSKVSVFNGDPANGGKLIKQGAVGVNFMFKAKLRVATTVQTLFLQILTVTGYTEVAEVPVENTINYTFSEPAMKFAPDVPLNGPDCSSGCDTLLNGSGTAVIDGGMVFCITDHYTGHLSIRNGTVKVCGTFSGTVSMGQEENSCHLIVTSTGSADITALTMTRECSLSVYGSARFESVSMANNAFLENYGETTINNNFSHPNLLENFGELTINGEYLVNGTASELLNLGTIIVNSDWDVSGYVDNYGTIEVFGNIDFHGKTVYNRCKIVCYQQVVFNTMLYHSDNGYLHSELELTVTSGAKLVLMNQSMLSASDFIMSNSITGQGSCSVIKCTLSASITSSARYVTGPIEMLTPDGTLVSGSYPENFLEGAVLLPLSAATAYVPATACNPEGSGQLSVLDSDGDGIANLLDYFPADDSRAFISWYPAASSFGSLIFEDLWPYKGDYDMNDAVIDYQFKVITNARNQVVDIQPKFYLRAAGAAFKNGFGFQFDGILPEMIGSVTGYNLKFGYVKLNDNGTESSQANAVIIVWDNADNLIHFAGPSPMFNTLPDYPAGYSDSVFINIHFKEPQDQYILKDPPYNPFLIKNMDRGVEIHMPDFIPTSLANPLYFSSGEDDSDPAEGRYYKTVNNLLWATNISEKYDYTYETIAILYGYNNFAEWCQASGNSYPDWYYNLEGYRNEAYIYTIPKK